MQYHSLWGGWGGTLVAGARWLGWGADESLSLAVVLLLLQACSVKNCIREAVTYLPFVRFLLLFPPSFPKFTKTPRMPNQRMPPGHMQKIGGGGRGTASSVSGGLFGAPPEAVVRERLDGKAHGRGNSSSVAGGIFSDDGGPQNDRMKQQSGFNPTFMSQEGGPLSWDHGGAAPAYQPKYSQNGNGSVWDGAAGGKSTNAAQVRDGHFRGALNQENHTTLGRSQPQSNQSSARSSARSSGFDLDVLSSAEQRDEDDRAEMLVKEAAEDLDTIERAAAQIADEQGLSELEEYNLIQKLRANLQTKAAIIEQRNSARQSHRQQQQQILSMQQARSFDAQSRQPFREMSAQSGNQRLGRDNSGSMMAAKQAPAAGFHSSTKVAAPPGGASSIMFG